MTEPKKTERASMAMVTSLINKQPHILLLYRTKWEDEGTPWIFPGGGLRDDETPIEGLWRELKEETRIEEGQTKSCQLVMSPFQTKWTDEMFMYQLFLVKEPVNKYPRIFYDWTKFSGYFWLNPLSGIRYNFDPLIMPGAKKALDYVYGTSLPF